MLHQPNGLSFQSPLRRLCVLVFHLLLTHSCRGQSTLIGPLHSIEAAVGDDVILPCHLEPVMDVTSETLEWKRSDLNPRYVHVLRSRQNLENVQNPSYRGRTSLFTDELKRGNISLKLSKVQLSDQGTYECDIPLRHKQSSVKLVVASGSASYPFITLAGIDEVTRGVMIDCRSEDWYPEPEVLWLDGEGNLLSAGPPETVRGPDDLYTVSSRVTVEKRHSNRFTCRVQQKNTNQTRETHFSISNDFFKLQSSSVPVITGLAVSLAVCIVFILLLLFVVWRWRQNIIKTKRSCRDQTDEGEKKKHSKTNKSEDQCVTEKREREQLMTHETVEMKRSEQQLQKEQQRREEAEKEVQTLKEELQTKKNERETKGAELQQLHEEKKRNDNELQSLKEELENKKKEMERIMKTPSRSSSYSLLKGNQADIHSQLLEETQRREDAQREVEKLKNELESKKKELKDKQAAEAQMKKTNEDLKRQLKMKDESISQLMREFNKQLHDEKQKKEEAERDLKRRLTKNHEFEEKLQEEKTKREEAGKEMENVKKEMEDKSSSASQSSNTELPILIEVNQKGNYIHLIKKSPKDQRLGGWTLEMEVNKKIITYTFKPSFKLKSRNTITMFGPGCFQQYDLRWKDLTPWNSGDSLKFTLISDTGVRHQLNSYSLSGY